MVSPISNKTSSGRCADLYCFIFNKFTIHLSGEHIDAQWNLSRCMMFKFKGGVYLFELLNEYVVNVSMVVASFFEVYSIAYIHDL